MSNGLETGIDLEDCFPLGEADRYFPRPNGKRVSIKTLYRWAARGVRGVKRKTIRLGHQRCTRDAWIRQFAAELNVCDASSARQIRPSGQETVRRRGVNAALDAAGI
jgi:hypothetical protein